MGYTRRVDWVHLHKYIAARHYFSDIFSSGLALTLFNFKNHLALSPSVAPNLACHDIRPA